MNTNILQILSDSNSITKSSYAISNINIMYWLCSIELIIIIVLLLKINRSKINLKFNESDRQNLKNHRNSSVDFSMVMNSINGSGQLYKELSKKCHPDRFVGTPLHKHAEELFQEISEYKRNYEKLVSLKERAIVELNILF